MGSLIQERTLFVFLGMFALLDPVGSITWKLTINGPSLNDLDGHE